MKKWLSSLLAAAMVVAALTGCGSTPAATPVPTTAPTPAASAPITITFAAQDDPTPATQAVIDAFNASQTQYVAVWDDMTNDSGAMQTQLITSLSAGSSDYDVMSLDVAWAGQFAATGYIDPIDSYMQTDGLSTTDFNAGSMASGNYSAKQYTLPFFPDLGILYFRSDIVSADDKAKLESGNYTWDDLYNMAETYKGQGGTTDGFAFQAKQYEGLICNANEFTNNFTDIQGGLTEMKKFTDGDVSPADILNYDEGATDASFGNGQSVFSRNWPYQWGVIATDAVVPQSNVDVAPLPNGGSVGGWLLSMNKNSKNKDGAWALMKFIATDAGQQIMSTKGGYLPGYNATLQDANVIAANAMLSMPGFQKALLTTIARPVSSNYSQLSDTMQIAIHKYLSGGATIDDTVKAVNDALANK